MNCRTWLMLVAATIGTVASAETAIAPAMALPAAFDRIDWIPHTFPQNPLSTELYPLLALAPMLVWDIFRNRRVHRAYWVFVAVYLPAAMVVHAAWDQPWWHLAVRRLMGV